MPALFAAYRSAIANSIRLLDLPEPILAMVAAKELSAGHARTLLGVKDHDDMLLLAQFAAEQDLSVRQLEEHGFEAEHVYYDGPNGYDNYILIKWEDDE